MAPVAILAGLVLEGMKYIFLLIWPLLRAKLEREYGVFRNSVTILIWGFAGRHDRSGRRAMGGPHGESK